MNSNKWSELKVDHLYMYVELQKDFLLLLFICGSTLANGMVPAITSILTGKVFDLLQKFAQPQKYDKEYLENQLTLKSMSILALGAACIPVMWISISSWMSLGERQGFRVRSKLLKEYLNKPMEWYDLKDNLSGDFTQVNRCVEELRSGSAEASAVTYQNCVAIIALICVSMYYSWQLTLIILCSSPLIVALAVVFSRLIQRYTALENSSTTLAADILAWTMNSAQTVKLFCSQEREINSFEDLTLTCNDYFIKMCLYMSANVALLRFLTLSMFVQGFWFGCTMIKKGKLNISSVITCFYSCLLLGSILNTTLHHVIYIQKGQVALAKIQTFLKDKTESKYDSMEDNKISYNNANICIQDVTFSYPSRPTENILKNVSMNINTGRTTYIVGKSGSGKSTITNLLLKFYENYEGTISINDIDLRSIATNELLKNITLVEQRCTLFNDSLKNNILLGTKYSKQPIDSEHLSIVCSLACLDSVISSLPDGLDTKIGTDGVTLSGGQQQRVALARAFLRDPDILILDEAISALDIMQREILMNNISKIRQNKTTIILTHDLNQINEDDYIYLFDNNEIKEHGYQKELLGDDTTSFYYMYKLQQKITFSESTASSPTVYENDLDYKLKEEPLLTPGSGETFDVMKYYSEELSDETSVSLSYSKLDEESQESNNIIPIKAIIRRMIRNCNMKLSLLLGLICAIIAGVTNPLFSWSFSYLLNGIVPTTNGVGSSSYLLKWSLIVLGISLADGIFNFFKLFVLGCCSEYWIMDLRNELMRSISKKKFEWFSRSMNKSSEISALALNDLRDLRTLVSQFLATLSTFLTVSIMGLVWAIATGWKLSLVCISMFPLIVIFSIIYGKVLQNYETSYKSAVAELENLQYEMVSSIKTIKCLQLHEHFLELYHNLEKKMKVIARKRSIVTGLGLSVITMITTCIQAILYYYGLKLVLIGEYTSKMMFQTFTLLLFTIMTCNSLISQIPDVTRGQRAASWILRIIDEGDYTKESDSPVARIDDIEISEKDKPLIEITNLDFQYPTTPNIDIYSSLNLKLNGRQTIGLVGQSGSGKSSLMYILTKLYDVSDNKIFIDGTDINMWNNEALRNQISVVEQKPALFPGSIRENIQYGLSDHLKVSDAEMIDTLKLVGIYDFIDSLPNKLETVVDTGLLSGGQAQRVCIARALLRKPKILILDECTSALDAESARIINDLVSTKLHLTMLTIIITHSEQMMKACDNLFLLHQGCIIEEGQLETLNKPGCMLYNILATDN